MDYVCHCIVAVWLGICVRTCYGGFISCQYLMVTLLWLIGLTTAVCIDACPVAAGGVYQGQFIYTPWDKWPGTRNHHITYKETLALEPAATIWGPLWANKTVYIHCDNQAAVQMINRGSSHNPLIMDSLRRIFWLSAIHNFRLRAIYLPGIYNQIADCVSRLHENNSLKRLQVLLASANW